MKQTFVLSWPPSTNSLWRAVKGRNILSARARDWAKEAALELMVQKARPVKGPVHVRVELRSPNSQAFDVDNRLKGVLDLLVKNLVIESDNHRTVQRITAEVSNDASFTGARITVSPIIPREAA